MSASNFTILSKVQDVEVKFDELKGSFDGLRSILNVFISFTYRRPLKDMSFDVLAITGKLRLDHSSKLLSETIVTPGVNIRVEEFSTGEWFNFILDDTAIHAIEAHRKGDLILCIDLSIVVIIKTAFQNNQNSQLFYSTEGTNRVNAKISFTIPQSIWVKKIYPSFGGHSFKLIEIPLYHKNLKEVYKDIIDEFNKAEEYFNQGDYNKTVAHCRHTMDALTRNLKKIKESNDSESGFKWLKEVDEATFQWIDSMNKANQAITSKTHHSGQKNSFTRQEAESIYLIILGLLNYIGNLR